MPSTSTDRRAAFAIAELAAVIAVVVLLVTVLLVLGAEARHQGRLGEDLSKFRQIGGWTASYAADNADQLWTFSWKKGTAPSSYPSLNFANDDLQAAANQAVDILKRVAGREDIQQITGWLAHPGYSHLPLQEWLNARMPDLAFVSAADPHRLRWARDPLGFDAGYYSPAPPNVGSNDSKRWPYSASFQLAACWFDRSQVGSRVHQAGTQNTFNVPPMVAFGGAALSLVTHPSLKVLLNDENARHFGTVQPYCTHAQARLPILFGDGAVGIRAAADSNLGWLPTQPASVGSTQFLYVPAPWQPPPVSGASESVRGRFRWTRGTVNEHGIAGRDFGAPETCSGQPGCP